MTTEPVTSRDKPNAGERWRLWLLVLLAALAIAAVVAARPWLRPWAAQAMCEVSCTPWAMTVFGWAVLAPMPWLFVLLELALARRARRPVVVAACAAIVALACVFFPAGTTSPYRWLGLEESLTGAFVAGVGVSKLALTLFCLGISVRGLGAQRRKPRLEPASLSGGVAWVVTLGGLALALSGAV